MLNLHHLKYFHDAVLQGGVAPAAARNRVSSSAISQAVRGLEASLGSELLEHRKNSFRLTEAGHLLAARCRELFDQVDRLRRDLEGARAGVTGRLSITVSHSLAVSILPAILARFARTYPGVRLDLRTGNALVAREHLRSRETEIALALDDEVLAGLPRRILQRGLFVLVEARKPARRRMRRPKSESGKALFLVGDRGREVAELRNAWRRLHGNELPTLARIPSWEVIAALAARGLGIGLVPEFLLAGPLGAGLRTARITGLSPTPYELCAFYRSEGPLSRPAEAFLSDVARRQRPSA